MNPQAITDGHLLAYLDGANLPEVEQALSESPELRDRLEALRQEEQFLRKVFGESVIVEPQDTVDVVTGHASPEQRLRVSAYLRKDPAARKEMDDLGKFFLKFQKKSLPQFFAIRLAAASLRESRESSHEQSYYAAELHTQVSLSIIPPDQERWQVHGRVTNENQAVMNARVTLSSRRFRPRPKYTDENGFFDFHRLHSDVYHLRVYLPSGILIIPEIILNDE